MEKEASNIIERHMGVFKNLNGIYESNIDCCAKVQTLAERKDKSCKIMFGPANFEKISHYTNRQAWLKRALDRQSHFRLRRV